MGERSIAPFVGVATLLVASTVFDHVSTSAARSRLGPDFREANPLMRNRTLAPVLSVSIDVALLYHAYRNWRDGDALWWAPSISSSLLHTAAGLHNTALGR